MPPARVQQTGAGSGGGIAAGDDVTWTGVHIFQNTHHVTSANSLANAMQVGDGVDYLSLASIVSIPSIQSTDRLDLISGVADGASAIAFIKDTTNSLVTSGANHTVWRNNTSDLMILDKDGQLGIGIAPERLLHVAGESAGGIGTRVQFAGANDTDWPSLNGRRSRGTLASPSAVSDGDRLFGFLAQGYSTNGWPMGNSAAGVWFEVDGSPGAGYVPGKLTFRTTQDLSNKDLARLTIKSNGNVGIGETTPVATLDVNGGIAVATVSKTTTYTATTSDHVILCDATGGAFTVTLPAATSSNGLEYHIKKVDSSANAVTIDGNGAETIDGAATYSLASQYDSVMIVCDGASWYIV